MAENSEGLSDFSQKILLSMASILNCAKCGEQEHVVALDDQEIDEVYAANYLCDECEEGS
jgi:hypothetical protein